MDHRLSSSTVPSDPILMSTQVILMVLVMLKIVYLMIYILFNIYIRFLFSSHSTSSSSSEKSFMDGNGSKMGTGQNVMNTSHEENFTLSQYHNFNGHHSPLVDLKGYMDVIGFIIQVTLNLLTSSVGIFAILSQNVIHVKIFVGTFFTVFILNLIKFTSLSLLLLVMDLLILLFSFTFLRLLLEIQRKTKLIFSSLMM